jgi:nitrate reductase assembly molybdenum cofactor insertion protein NarJ
MKEDESIEQLLNLNSQLNAVQKEEMKDHLIFYLNHLLLHDFDKLVQILYRVDVSETKLKEVLQKNSGTDAAIIIADLLMQRQEEKIKTKEAFKSNNDLPGEDKW